MADKPWDDGDWQQNDELTSGAWNQHVAEHREMYDPSTDEVVADVNNQTVDTDSLRTTDTQTITVNVPTDFDTLAAAVERAAEQQVPAGTTVEVNIESGHTITTRLLLTNGYYGYIKIVSEDTEPSIGADFPADTDFYRLGRQCWGPELACRIDAQGNCRDGAIAEDNSKFKVDVDCGVKNAGRRGVYARNSSRIDAPNSVWDGADQEGVDCFRNSHINVFNSSVKNVGLDAVRGARGGSITCGEATLTGAGRDAVRTTRQTFVNAYRADLRNATRNAVRCSRYGPVNAQGADCRGSGQETIYCAHGSTIVVRNTTLSDSTNPSGSHVIFVSRGGEVIADSVTATHSGGAGVYAEFGGEVDAQALDVSNATEEGVYAELGEVTCGNVTADDCGSNPLYTEGGKIIATGITSAGCPSPIRANEGGKVVLQGGAIDTDATVDARADRGSYLQLNGCTTSASTGGDPHADDVNFTGLDEANGVIFGNFETA